MKQTNLCLALLASCATEGEFRDRVSRRVGHDLNDVIRRIGPPRSEYVMPNGNHVFSWTWYGTEGSPVAAFLGGMGQGMSGGDNPGARTWRTMCTLSYEVDANTARIVSYRYEGNGCKA